MDSRGVFGDYPSTAAFDYIQNHKQEMFTAHSLAKKTGYGRTTIRRELERFTNIGILEKVQTRSSTGSIKYYYRLIKEKEESKITAKSRTKFYLDILYAVVYYIASLISLSIIFFIIFKILEAFLNV